MPDEDLEVIIHQTLKSSDRVTRCLRGPDIRREYGADVDGVDHVVDVGHRTLVIQDGWSRPIVGANEVHDLARRVAIIEAKEGRSVHVVRLSRERPSERIMRLLTEKAIDTVYGAEVENVVAFLVEYIKQYVGVSIQIPGTTAEEDDIWDTETEIWETPPPELSPPTPTPTQAGTPTPPATRCDQLISRRRNAVTDSIENFVKGQEARLADRRKRRKILVKGKKPKKTAPLGPLG